MTYYNKKKSYLHSLPPDVFEELLREQVAQGNPRNISIFYEDISADKRGGGFNWGESKLGRKFWRIIFEDNYFNYTPPPELNINLILV